VYVRSLAFRTDLALHRLAGAQVEDRGDLVVVRTPHNPAYRWGNCYVLPRPPEAAEVDALLARYDADFHGGTHRALGIDGTTDQRDALGPLVAAGLRDDTATVMTATSVHPPPRPNGDATLRPLVSEDDWVQRVEVSVAVDDSGTDPASYLDFATRRAQDERRLCEEGHGMWWGAFLDGRLTSVMGLVDAGEGLARYQNVETHPDYRGRGLAGTLVHRVAAHGFDEMRARTLVMVADPGYLAIRIYRSVGFADTETQTLLDQPDRTSAQDG
jgi:ribosomal protein S18 acetylase RimI-like enzyme